MHRVTVRYEGRVQGVGFRVIVFDLSRDHDVAGYVRNMFDGTVEMVVEGDEAILTSFLHAILHKMSRNIVSHNANWQETETASFDSFRIAPTHL